MYHDHYDKVRIIVKRDACMMRLRLLYLETNASVIGLRAGLLQMRDGMNCGCDKIPDNAILHPIAFSSKSLSSVEQCYNNFEHKAHGILHGIEKFNHH